MERKYLAIIIGFVLSVSTFVIIFVLHFLSGPGLNLIPPEYITEFIVIIPGPIYTDILWIYLIPLGIFIIYYLIAPYLVIFYIKLHRFFYWLIRRPSKYGVFNLEGKKVSAGRLFYRALIVSLFSFSIAFLLIKLGDPSLFRANMASKGTPTYFLNLAEVIFLATFAVCPFMIIIFFPIWQLEDSGVTSYRTFHDERMPADIQGVHSIYHHMLLGYAGISTILTWIISISDIFKSVPELGAAILTPIILIILPFIVTGLLAIPIYLYERYLPKNNERVLSRFDFPEIKIPRFEELRD